MKKLFLVTVSVVALPVVAYAAELPLSMKAPVFAPPPLLTWAGSYVGILGGVAYHRATLNPNCTPDLGLRNNLTDANRRYNWHVSWTQLATGQFRLWFRG